MMGNKHSDMETSPAEPVYEVSGSLARKPIESKNEKMITSSWGELLSVDDTIVKKETPIPDKEIMLLQDMYSPDECRKLIAEAESHGFGKTNYQKSYRGNLRLITSDESLANIMWCRIKQLVPATVTEGGVTYEAVGLNHRWRCSKYYEGDLFARHVDAFFEDTSNGIGNGVKSMFTVNIYMNDDFEGGKTTFIFHDPNSKGNKAFDESLFHITPQPGMGLIFRQPPQRSYLHEGEVIRSGIKYLFRTDIMYKRCPSKQHFSSSIPTIEEN